MQKTLFTIFLVVIFNCVNAQTFEWATSFGGILNDEPSSVATDAMGNVYTTGHFAGTVDFDPGSGTSLSTSAGQDDIFIYKLDALGNFMWVKTFGGIENDLGQDVLVDANGNVYVTGSFQQTVDFDPGAGTLNVTAAGGSDVFILVLDATGNLLRVKTFGGTGYESGSAIASDIQGNLYTTGYFFGTTDLDPGTGSSYYTSVGIYDVFVQKLDNACNFIWAKAFGGSDLDFSNTLNVDANGNVYTTGTFQTTVDFDPGTGTNNILSNGDFDVFVQKLDGAGNFVWAKTFGGTGYDNAASYLDGSGNIYTIGSFTNSVDFDPGTGSNIITSNGGSDIFIQKLNTTGGLDWVKSFGGSANMTHGALAINSNGDLYTNGYFDGTVDFDPGVGTFNLVAGPSGSMFVQKLNASGNFEWTVSFGDDTDPTVRDLAIDNMGNIITVGGFYNNADFDPGAGSTILTSYAEADVFVQKMSPVQLGVNEFQNMLVEVSPQLMSDKLNINIHMSEPAEIIIYEISSKKVLQQKFMNATTINTQQFGKGIYVYQVLNKNGIMKTGKVVKY